MYAKIDVRTTALQTMNSVRNDLLCIRFRHHHHHSFMLFTSSAIRRWLALSLHRHVLLFYCIRNFSPILCHFTYQCSCITICSSISWIHVFQHFILFIFIFIRFDYKCYFFAVGDNNGIESTGNNIARASV